MWMPQQMEAHAAKLKELGLELDPKLLADPVSSVLGAVVSLGGCSASFVSDEGLVITNHHCSIGALQYNSSPKEDLLHDGWVAKTRADERSNGPTARVLVTQAIAEVTDDVRRDLAKVKDDRARHKEIEKRTKDIIAACEKGRPGIRCGVGSFYEGSRFFRVEQLEIRDVRLVYAPAEGVGSFGGEIDNWRWPRHAGDVAIFRAYVGKDGKPADFAQDNVPYRPPHRLRLATKPLAQGDLVFVAGYPGRTSQQKTADEVRQAVTLHYPRRLAMFEEYVAVLEKLGKTDREIQQKATPLVRGFNNALTNTKGQLEGLTKGGLLRKKQASHDELVTWISADPGRKARFGATFEDLKKIMDEAEKHLEADAQLDSEIPLARLVSAAVTLVRIAEERAKPDPDRDPDYQERNWPRQKQALAALEKRYNRALDQELLATALRRALRKTGAERTGAAGVILGRAGEEAIAKAVGALYATTALEDTKIRADLFDKATTADLRKRKDPLLDLALALRPLQKEMEERNDRHSGKRALLKPLYFEALRAFAGKELAPDANGTLRLTYGTVKGYRPTPDAPVYTPFTLLPEIAKKATGKDPFESSPALLDAIKKGKRGPYVDPVYGDVPVDFLSDLHITGGNSGSATLNARGEITGLVFDGNYEAIASDWVFDPVLTRSIHVDIRYVQWLLDAVDGGDHILKEMGGTPSVE
jgi:hypothetical protein